MLNRLILSIILGGTFLLSYSENRFYENRYSSIDTGIVIFSFDDNFQCAIDSGLSYLNSKGFKGTINIDCHKFNGAFQSLSIYPQATDSTLLYMQLQGNSIFIHSYTTIFDPDVQTTQTLRNEYYNASGTLLNKGFDIPFIVSWPYGHDSLGKTAISDIYDYGRKAVNSGYVFGLNTVPILDSMRLSQYDVMPKSNTSYTSIIESIDSAIAEKRVLAIRWHAIGTGDSYELNYSPTTFRAIVDYCVDRVAEGELKVLSFVDLLKIRPSVSGITRRKNKSMYATIYGFGFQDSAHSSTVTIGGSACSGLNQSNNHITVTVPTGISDGTKQLVITNYDGYKDSIQIDIKDSKQDSARMITNADYQSGLFCDRKRQLSNIDSFPLFIDLSKMPILFSGISTRSNIAVADISTNPIGIIGPKWTESIDSANKEGTLFIIANISTSNRKEYSVQSGLSLDYPDSNTFFSKLHCFMRLGFEETSGNPIDATGNYTISVVKGKTYPTKTSDGAFGNSNAWLFNSSSNGYLNCGDVTLLNSANKFSIEFMVYITSHTVQQVLSKYISDNDFFNINIGYDWGLYVGAGRSGNVYVAGATLLSNNTIDSLYNNHWHHACIVYDGTQATNDGKLKLYWDGNPVVLTMQVGTNVDNVTSDLSGASLKIANGNANQYLINAKLDEVCLYSDVKSGDWVSARYAQFIGGGLMNDYEISTNGNFHWQPTGVSRSFTDDNNWLEKAVPTMLDTAYFDSAYSNAVCTVGMDLGGIYINATSNYSGNIVFTADTCEIRGINTPQIKFLGSAKFRNSCTIKRLITTPGKKYIFEAGDSVTLSSYTFGDFNGTAGHVSQYASSVLGTQFILKLPEKISVLYTKWTDCKAQ